MEVISLAVLADTEPGYRPNGFKEEVAGSGVHFRFRTVKLLDFEPGLDELLAGDNPFALLVAAQLTAKRVKDGKGRVDSLIGFYRLAIKQQLERELIERLQVFLEWLVALPPEIEGYYTEQVDQLKEEKAMPYVSILERRAIEKGMEKGIQIGEDRGRSAMLSRQLQLKFGELPDELRQRLDQANEAELDVWAERILFAENIEKVFG
ncbi:MAG: hypothetical protein WC997_13080 [Porticoccaceae bacterium]